MIKGWHFVNGTFHYYVGAKDADAAMKALRRHDSVAAATSPAQMSSEVAEFFQLRDGKVVSGVVLTEGKRSGG